MSHPTSTSEVVILGQGVRLVNGERMYSAAWLNDVSPLAWYAGQLAAFRLSPERVLDSGPDETRISS